MFLPWIILLFASAGVFDHSGIKIPFFAFFFHDSGKRVEEAPWNMLWAMGIAAFLCIFLGVFPQPLYAILPYEVDFSPYTLEHVVTQMQLLMFAALAFTWLMRSGAYPPEIPGLNVDFDVTYRKGLPAVIAWARATFGPGRCSGSPRFREVHRTLHRSDLSPLRACGCSGAFGGRRQYGLVDHRPPRGLSGDHAECRIRRQRRALRFPSTS